MRFVGRVRVFVRGVRSVERGVYDWIVFGCVCV